MCVCAYQHMLLSVWNLSSPDKFYTYLASNSDVCTVSVYDNIIVMLTIKCFMLKT